MRRPCLGVWMGWRVAIAIACVLALARPAVAQEPQAEREITVLNHSQKVINEIYISPATSDQWGADWLGEHTIGVGGSQRLRLGRTRTCVFDAKVIYEDASREENRGVNICHTRVIAFDGSGATMPPETAAEHEVTLVNNAPRPIQQVYLSPAEAAQWGDDRLANSSLSVADRIRLVWRGDCVVDLRIVFDNRAAEERRGVDVCSTPVLSIEPGWTTKDTPPTTR